MNGTKIRTGGRGGWRAAEQLADYLSEERTQAIFYDNAARFFDLEDRSDF